MASLPDDSDVEVVDNGGLRRTFHRQQIRLIAALSKCEHNIPKDWLAFKKFVERFAVGAIPNEQVIRTTWLKLCTVENIDNNSTNSANIIEISDEDDVNDHGSSLNRSFIITKKKRRKRSLPSKMNEEELEKLREQLLMDRLLELELPQVLKDINLELSINRKRRCSERIRKSRIV